MPHLRPFRGLRYDSTAVPDAGAVICPPYDVISAAERATLAGRHRANAVHIELPESYEKAAQLFAQWQRDGILRRDDRPMIYVYEEGYPPAGEGVEGGARRSARGFLCRLRLEEPGATSGVRAHEQTMSAPKEDRFRLLSAVRANLSPVVLLYEAPADVTIDLLLDGLTAGVPGLDAVDDAGLRHRLWPVDAASSVAVTELLGAAGRGALTIADGHHRYQTALRYCNEVGGGGADHVLALLIEAGSGGLDVLATHRLVRGAIDIDVMAEAAELFEIEPLASAAEVTDALEPGAIGVWTRRGGGRLRARPDRVARLFPRTLSPALRELDVTLLNAAYPTIFGATAEELTAGDRIGYTKSAPEAIAAVDAGTADVCFLLAPTPVSAVLDVAAAGEVMPPKSTYFYPKPATGLVFNVLDA